MPLTANYLFKISKKFSTLIPLPPLVFFIVSLFSINVFSDEEIITETYKVEKHGLSGWKKKDDSCKYAIIAARKEAIKSCKNKQGEIPYSRPILSTCSKCKQSKYFNEWYCTGVTAVTCRYVPETTMMSNDKKPKLSPINNSIRAVRGLLQKHNKDIYTETNNPCTIDANTVACKDYRKVLSSGVRN